MVAAALSSSMRPTSTSRSCGALLEILTWSTPAGSRRAMSSATWPGDPPRNGRSLPSGSRVNGTFARTTTLRPAGSRPASSAASRKVVASAGTTSPEKAIGLMPSAIRPARRAPAGVVAPSSTGRRSWTGLGFTSEGAIR